MRIIVFRTYIFRIDEPPPGTSAHSSNDDDFQVVPRYLRKKRNQNNNITGALPVDQPNTPMRDVANASYEYEFIVSAIDTSTPINMDIPSLSINLWSSESAAVARDQRTRVSVLKIVAEESQIVHPNESAVENTNLTTKGNPIPLSKCKQSNKKSLRCNATGQSQIATSYIAETPILMMGGKWRRAVRNLRECNFFSFYSELWEICNFLLHFQYATIRKALFRLKHSSSRH